MKALLWCWLFKKTRGKKLGKSKIEFEIKQKSLNVQRIPPVRFYLIFLYFYLHFYFIFIFSILACPLPKCYLARVVFVVQCLAVVWLACSPCQNVTERCFWQANGSGCSHHTLIHTRRELVTHTLTHSLTYSLTQDTRLHNKHLKYYFVVHFGVLFVAIFFLFALLCWYFVFLSHPYVALL